MGENHTDHWVARPTHSTGFGLASIAAVNEAFEAAFFRVAGSKPEKVEVRLHGALPVDRRYELSITDGPNGSLNASMGLNGVVVADATALFHSSS